MKILTQVNPLAILQFILFGGLFNSLLFLWSGAPMAAVCFSFVAGGMLTALLTLITRSETVIIVRKETDSSFERTSRFCSMQDAQDMLDVPEEELFRFVNTGNLKFVRCRTGKNRIDVGFRTIDVNALVQQLVSQDAMHLCCSVDEAFESLGVTFQEFADYVQDGVLPAVRRRDRFEFRIRDGVLPGFYRRGGIEFRIRDVNNLIAHLLDEQKTDNVMYTLDCVDRRVAMLTLDVGDGVFETLVRCGAIKTCTIRGRACYFRPSLERVKDPLMEIPAGNKKAKLREEAAPHACAKQSPPLPQLAEIVVYRDEDHLNAQLLRRRGKKVILRMWRFEGRIYVLKKDLDVMQEALERSEKHGTDSARDERASDSPPA